MTLGPVAIDAEKIYALIEQQDLPPRARRGRGSGKRAAFAEKIGRSPGSIWNLKQGRVISRGFATQIADALGVPLSAITALAEDDEDTPGEPDEPDEVDVPGEPDEVAA